MCGLLFIFYSHDDEMMRGIFGGILKLLREL
jgi:hypothetical protein